MDTSQSIIAELEDAIRDGSPDKRTETLRRATDLFLSEAARLTERICLIESSRDYRFGRLLVDPIRRFKRLMIRWFGLSPLNGLLRHPGRINPRLAG